MDGLNALVMYVNYKQCIIRFVIKNPPSPPLKRGEQGKSPLGKGGFRGILRISSGHNTKYISMLIRNSEEPIILNSKF